MSSGFDFGPKFFVLIALAFCARQLFATSPTFTAVSFSVISLGALSWVLGLPSTAIGILLACIVATLVGIRLTQRLAETRPNLAALFAVLPTLLAWVLGKEATRSMSSPARFFAFVGLSFFVVKAWTLIKDVHAGDNKRLSIPIAIAYFLYFPTYALGPMHLFREFESAINETEAPVAGGTIDAVYRLLLGLVKIKVVAPLLIPTSLLAFDSIRSLPLKLAVPASVVYSAVLLLDFSGYSDIAIASSKLIGIKVPENFRAPYLSPNIREFWQRWHISFSRVLTGYVFVPFSRALEGRAGMTPDRIKIAAYAGTFVLCGYWHGPTLNFLLWGLYHGIGLILYDRFRPKKPRRRQKNPSSRERFTEVSKQALAVCATFLFVSLGWILFVLPISKGV